MTPNSRASAFLTLAVVPGVVAMLFASGCAKQPAPAAQATAAAQNAAPEAQKTLALSVPLLDVMRAAVEIPADGLWAAQSEDKLSDKEWLLADQDSVALAAAATLVSMGGTGAKDKQWVANGDWQAWAQQMQSTALQLRAAAKSKDQTKFNAAADELVMVCQNCHTKYRPEVPSDGVIRYPFYPARALPK